MEKPKISLWDLKSHPRSEDGAVLVLVEVCDEPETNLFEKFVAEAKKKLPLKTKEVEVRIRLSAKKTMFHMPKRFLNFVSRQGWEVTLDVR